MRPAALAAALLCVCACGSSGKKPAAPEVPHRAHTAGDDILPSLPAGADLVIELDLARLRANSVVGPVVAAVAALPGDQVQEIARTGGAVATLAVALVGGADAAVVAAYRVGSPDAVTLVAVRGGDALPGAAELGGGLRLAGPDEWVGRARAVMAGSEPGLDDDATLMVTRAQAMPAKASGAWLRVAGRFGFDARVEMASRFDLDVAPASVSMWADVADDLALVAVLGGGNGDEVQSLVGSLQRTRERGTRNPIARALGLAPAVAAMRIERGHGVARAIFLVGPHRLQRVASRAVKLLSPDAPEGERL